MEDHEKLEETNQNKDYQNTAWNLVLMIWIVALVATMGSLYFSEIKKFVPCSFCWYQRIAMYPLILIFLVAVYAYDKAVIKFALPLVVIGWSIAIYQNLLIWGIIPADIVPCLIGVPCSLTYINWFGFVSIPLLSLMAFTIIFILLIFLIKLEKKHKH